MLRNSIKVFCRTKSTSTTSSTASATAAVSRSSTKEPKAAMTQVNAAQPAKHTAPASTLDPSEYQRRLEERFGGGEAAALGQLVDGKPEGLASNVKRNMFRLI
ncbi:hypothetical protein JCM11641_006955 [Rhodosporidiobolus odoratus]